MKALIYICLILLLIMPAEQIYGAERARMTHVMSIYDDGNGLGILNPEDVECSSNDDFIVADTGRDRLLKFKLTGKKAEPAGEIKLKELRYPTSVKTNSKGEIFALDGRSRKILIISPEGEFQGYLTPDKLRAPSKFITKSIHVDWRDNIYILDIYGQRILVLDKDAHLISQIRFPKDIGFISELTVDFKGGIFLVDSVKNRVYAADRASGAMFPLTTALDKYLRFPTNISSDERGRLYIVDRNGSLILVMAQDGSILGELSGMGWKDGLLNYPAGLCINEKHMFIADTLNNRIQIFRLIK
ncbi:MAG: NHL repeat-containing protein [Nitrospira sp.]|nr:NHL repeat-containing protein [bacterium]MBL7049938.1 NHL repeat-containing protein [Nitrospira sp.]